MNLHVGGGGADCMFDFLVSECWADEVAAGRGVEGQEMTSLSGCTFKVYSTVAAAVTQANTDYPTGGGITTTSTVREPVIFICSGSYTESATATDAVVIIGGGSSAVSWTAGRWTIRHRAAFR